MTQQGNEDCVGSFIKSLLGAIRERGLGAQKGRYETMTMATSDCAASWGVEEETIAKWRQGRGAPGARGNRKVVEAVVSDAIEAAGFARPEIEAFLKCPKVAANYPASKRRELLNKHFGYEDRSEWLVAREPEVAQIEKWLAAEGDPSSNLLLISGESGMGKSLLLREAMRRAGKAGVYCALFEPRSCHSRVAMFMQLNKQLGPRIPLPKTQATLTAIRELFLAAHQRKLVPPEVLNLLVDGILDRADPTLTSDVLPQLEHSALADTLIALREAFGKDAAMLEAPDESLRRALASDISRVNSAEHRIAIFVDEYEKYGQRALGTWLRDVLVDVFRSQGIPVAVAGTNPTTINDWMGESPVILRLQRFDLEQARNFLFARGIVDPAEQERVFESSRGVVFWLDTLAAEAARNNTMRLGTQIKRRLEPEAKEMTTRNILEDSDASISDAWRSIQLGLPEDALRVYEMALVLRGFNLERIARALGCFSREIRDAFTQLKSERWVQTNPSGYAVHERLRRAVLPEIKRDEPQRFAEVHKAAAMAYEGDVQSVANLIERLYHLSEFDELVAGRFLREQYAILVGHENVTGSLSELLESARASESPYVKLWALLFSAILSTAADWGDYLREAITLADRYPDDGLVRFRIKRLENWLNVTNRGFSFLAESKNDVEEFVRSSNALPSEKAGALLGYAGDLRGMGRFSQAWRAFQQATEMDKGYSDFDLLDAELLFFMTSGNFPMAAATTEKMMKGRSVFGRFVGHHEMALVRAVWGTNDQLATTFANDANRQVISWKTQGQKLSTHLLHWYYASVSRTACLTGNLDLALERIAEWRSVLLGREKSTVRRMLDLYETELLVGIHAGRRPDLNMDELIDSAKKNATSRRVAGLLAYSFGYKLLEGAKVEELTESGISALRVALESNCFIGESVLNNLISWTMLLRRQELPIIVGRILDQFMSDASLQEIERFSRAEEQLIEAIRPDHRTIAERMRSVLDGPSDHVRQPRPIFLIY